MRPETLDEIVGQDAILGPGRALRRAIEEDRLGSIVLWGPPGCGKTSLARVIARLTRAVFVPFSAVLSGVKDIRAILDEAARVRRAGGRRTILFVDEIHRFNKAQQDAFLPRVEDGTIVLIGATTENPSFEINSALLSRARVYRLVALDEAAIVAVLRRALADARRGLGELHVELSDDLLRGLAARCQGDARSALNALELAARSTPPDAAGRRRVREATLEDALQSGTLRYDRAGEEHFNQISALHKSMRDSDADAALYWLARMLEAGEDPLYVARRIVRFASEDVGLADPRALEQAVAAQQAVHLLGLPEGGLALAQAAVYCALAPKSNALVRGYTAARSAIAEGQRDPVPLALRNAPTGLMRREGYGAGYRYAHDHDHAVTDLECLPERLAGRRFYEPGQRGLEARLARRIEARRRAKARLRGK